MNSSVDTSHLVVGELYTHKDVKNTKYMFIGFSPNKRPVFQKSSGETCPYESRDPQNYKLYKPPVVHKRYLQWYKNTKTGKVVSVISEKHWDKEYESSFNYVLLSETVVTYTERQV
jgi:hypothetical protein